MPPFKTPTQSPKTDRERRSCGEKGSRSFDGAVSAAPLQDCMDILANLVWIQLVSVAPRSFAFHRADGLRDFL